MFMQILLSTVMTNVLYTLGAVLAVCFILFLSYLLNQKTRDASKPIVMGITYLLSFISIVAATAFLLWIWDFDLLNYLSDVGQSIVDTLTSNIGTLVTSVLVLFIALFVLKVIKLSLSRIGAKPSVNQKRLKTISKLIGSLSKYGIWLITILVILSIWGVNVGPALAGLGIAGLVIGLGAQKFINDLINGLFIIFEQHYDVGDIIDTNGFKGEVMDIGLKTTKLKNWKGEVKILANGDITDVLNCSRFPSLAIVDFGIGYGENIQEVLELLKEKLPEFKQLFPDVVIEDPQCLGVMELADSSVNMRAICKTLNNQHYGIERSLRTFIKKTLDDANVEIPFPQVVIHETK